MNPCRWIIAGLWLLFVVYWAVAAGRQKRTLSKVRWRQHIGLRLALVVVIVVLLQSRSLRQMLTVSRHFIDHSRVLGAFGVVLCLLGFALAMSARHYLGRNWGMPMSQKEQPELITRGPYAVIRHPIYSGLILALLGSGMAIGVVWILPLVLVGSYLLYSARCEEALMLRLFPEQYAAYQRRTGMLAPCPLRRR